MSGDEGTSHYEIDVMDGAEAQRNSANGAMLSAAATEIETASGRFVDLAASLPDTLRLSDIAQGMALTCRYGGQISRFYSVAEHAVLVHDLLAWLGHGRELRVAGLFHDAGKAYLGDVAAPLKFALRREEWKRDAHSMDPTGAGRRSAYDHLSDAMDETIAERYGVDLDALNSPALRVADMWALRIEARALTFTGGREWRWPGELPLGGEKPDSIPWAGGRDPARARAFWLAAVASYGIGERIGDVA